MVKEKKVEQRKRRRFLVVGGLIVLLLVIASLIAGFSYAAYFASKVNPHHTPPGIATACGTVIPLTGLRTFHIVSSQSSASYAVHEDLVLNNLPNNVAIGRTSAVQGTFRIRMGSSPVIAAMQIMVDLRTLKSDIGQRDYYVRRDYLESDTYPYATFISTCAQGLPMQYQDGQVIHFQITGNLTVHGKTNKEVFAVQGKVVGNTITGTATSTVYMTDFGIQPPNLAYIAIAQNKVLITITFTAQEG